MELFLFIYRFY